MTQLSQQVAPGFFYTFETMKFDFPKWRKQSPDDHEARAGQMMTHPEGYFEAREAHYIKTFGPITRNVHHSTDLKPVHIDIYEFEPTEGRPYWTLITSGMSNMRQLPKEQCDESVSSRTEILMYAHSPEPWMINVLKGLAEMPFLHKTFLYYGHTVPNGKPMTANPSLLTSFFFSPALDEDEDFWDFEINGDRVDFLCMIPITEAEREYAKIHGSRTLASLMKEREFSPVVDESRQSLV